MLLYLLLAETLPNHRYRTCPDLFVLYVAEEKNAELRKNLCTTMSHVYSSNAKDVHNITVQLSKSHQAIQVWNIRARLKIKMVFPRYGDSHFKDKTVARPSYL